MLYIHEAVAVFDVQMAGPLMDQPPSARARAPSLPLTQTNKFKFFVIFYIICFFLAEYILFHL
jgi:hypothetical protein